MLAAPPKPLALPLLPMLASLAALPACTDALLDPRNGGGQARAPSSASRPLLLPGAPPALSLAKPMRIGEGRARARIAAGALFSAKDFAALRQGS
jgi:hypothetical protein